MGRFYCIRNCCPELAEWISVYRIALLQPAEWISVYQIALLQLAERISVHRMALLQLAERISVHRIALLQLAGRISVHRIAPRQPAERISYTKLLPANPRNGFLYTRIALRQHSKPIEIKIGCIRTGEHPILFSKLRFYKLGLSLFHSEMAGTMLSVTSSSRILQRCS